MLINYLWYILISLHEIYLQVRLLLLNSIILGMLFVKFLLSARQRRISNIKKKPFLTTEIQSTDIQIQNFISYNMLIFYTFLFLRPQFDNVCMTLSYIICLLQKLFYASLLQELNYNSRDNFTKRVETQQNISLKNAKTQRYQ